MIRDVDGEEYKTAAGSWSNDMEAKAVIELCFKLVDANEWYDQSELQLQRIAVISPYTAQCLKISKGLVPLGLVCFTVDASQGGVRDVIIVSGVRNNERGAIGFLSDDRRLNVTLTRARARTVLFGNADTFYSANDSWFAWSHLLEHLLEKVLHL